MAIGQGVPSYDPFTVASGGLEIVPADWMPASDCRSLVREDPCALWLDWYGDEHGFIPAVSDYSFNEFVFRKGKELEAAWLHIYGDHNVRVCQHDGNARLARNLKVTLEMMNDGAPVIVHPALWWAPEKIYGAPDLIALSTWIEQNFPNALPPAEVNAGATGRRKGHYIALDIKIKTKIDENGNKKDLEIVTAQLSMYSYMLGHLQGYMPQSAFVICRDRVTSPFHIELKSVLNSHLDQPLASIRDHWLDIRLNGSKYLPWKDEVVHVNLSADNEKWDPSKKVIAAEKGTLFYNGKIPNDTFLGKAPFKGGAALEADWNGKVLWEVRHPNHHHDGRLLKNGNVLLLCATELSSDVARKVQGGRPGTEEKGKIWADYLVEMTKDGRTVWEWHSWEHLDPAKDVITAVQDERSEWTHGNAVIELSDSNLLVSFRDISTIIKIERRTGHILWKMGAPPLSGQHAPTPLPNGNILIFDNGPHRLDESFPFSRVIEVNPRTSEIVWKYEEGIPSNFFSPRISNAQRLPNGNTLVNDGWFGRFFEVTSDGEVVWEYVNPYFGPASEPAKAQNNNVFRIYRYTEKEIARARAAV